MSSSTVSGSAALTANAASEMKRYSDERENVAEAGLPALCQSEPPSQRTHGLVEERFVEFAGIKVA